MNVKTFLAVSVFATAFVLACKKESDTTYMKVRLTDAPASYEEVNIDLQDVQIKMASDTGNWISLPTEKGIYNLLEFQNGVDTLISQGMVPSGKVHEIRLVLGPDNSIKEGGETHPITIPSGSSSGLKLKLDKSLRSSEDSVTIDFDAAMSVKYEADGYKLHPVLRIVP